MNIRESINSKPWLGWAVAGVVLVLAAWLMFSRLGAGSDTYDPKRMQQTVTIKFTDTGETIEMPRGRLIKMLADQGGKIDPTKGIINPATKQPTGFLYDKAEWDELVKNINEDRAQAEAARKGAPPAAVPGK